MSTLLLLQRSRGYGDSRQRKEKPSRKNSPSYSWQDSSKKFTTPNGWQIQYLFLKRITTSGGCASTTQTSTSTARRIPSDSLASTKSSTRRPDVYYYPSWTATRAIIK